MRAPKGRKYSQDKVACEKLLHETAATHGFHLWCGIYHSTEYDFEYWHGHGPASRDAELKDPGVSAQELG